MGVAQRYGKVLLHNSFGIPKLAKYDMQFQTAGSAFDPENVWPNLIFDAAHGLENTFAFGSGGTLRVLFTQRELPRDFLYRLSFRQ